METDIAHQTGIINNLIDRGYGALVIAPADSRKLAPTLKKAVEQGIVVINIDNPLDRDAQTQYGLTLPFVGSDNAKGAALIGDYIRHQLHGKGRVIVIEGANGARNGELRKAGFLQAVTKDSALLHADETSWPEPGRPLWLWVFVATTATLYYVAGRGKELVENVLDGFSGGLMSDGWMAYRDYPRRLRCWAHLIRKARGLAESGDREARVFGPRVLTTLGVLMAAVYAAREGPLPVDLPTQHAPRVAALRAACEQRQGSDHAKTHALAVELLNDWDAIFQVLRHPELPLTNNEAERPLRHWVILRKLSLGTRTPVGSRVFALLASVIDTCRQRGHSPWRTLERAIADWRAGLPLAPLLR